MLYQDNNRCEWLTKWSCGLTYFVSLSLRTMLYCLYIFTGEEVPVLKVEPAKPSPIARVIDCITDDNLHDVTFKVHLRRLSLLSASAASSGDPNVYELIKYCAQVLRQLFNNCNHSSRQNFVKYVAREPVLMDFCLKAVLSSLESYSKSVV